MLVYTCWTYSEATWVHLNPSLPLFPFVRGEVLPATSSPLHMIVFSTLFFLLSSSSNLPPLMTSSHIEVRGSVAVSTSA